MTYLVPFINRPTTLKHTFKGHKIKRSFMKVYYVLDRSRCHHPHADISGDGHNIQLLVGQAAGRAKTYKERKIEFFHQLSAKLSHLTRLGWLHILGLQDSPIDQKGQLLIITICVHLTFPLLKAESYLSKYYKCEISVTGMHFHVSIFLNNRAL